ncbi:MAG: extensin family protein [Beijerinckiaceae bacterium]|nr:extensin family protein [Beijerinckiaceae bacterium]
MVRFLTLAAAGLCFVASVSPAPAERSRAKSPAPTADTPPALNAGSQPVSACQARLTALGLVTRAAPAGAGSGVSCTIAEPILLTEARFGEADEARGDTLIAFSDRPLLSCAMAEAFGIYVRDIVAPLARGVYGQPAVSIGTGPGFECRTRNHVPGARISSHAQGEAIDVAWITLRGGTKIAIGVPADDRAQRFIHALRAAGCGSFSTVLGPGSDPEHATHLHFDIEARGRDGKSKFCQ